MCLGQSYLDRLRKLEAEMKETSELLSRLESDIDKQVSKIYHDIERETFNVEGGYNLAKKLKDVLQERRVIKDEAARFRSVYHTFNETLRSIENRYKQAVRHSEKVRRSLNVKLTIEEVFPL